MAVCGERVDETTRTRAYAVVLRQGNVMETDTPNRRGYSASAKFLTQLLRKE